jgi:glucuronate isomerase
MSYLSEDFLLHGKTAQRLYHEFAEPEPILDYHCHLSPQCIAEDAAFGTITQLWIDGDHYKWRAMRSNGIDENFITGNASDEEKFSMWAKTVPFTVRNPLYDWAHLELKRYFEISGKLLSPETASEIYAVCNERLTDKLFSARNLLVRMKVNIICTTDDPVDDLKYHEQLKRETNSLIMLPTFRPDKAMAIEDPSAYNRYIDDLSRVSGISITSFSHLLDALDKRHSFFHEHGCRSSDHAIETLCTEYASLREINMIFSSVRGGKVPDQGQIIKFKTTLLLELSRMNHRRGWVQQFHFGVIHNVRNRVFTRLGPNAGVDCIGDFPLSRPLGCFLDALDINDQLTKTILFNINPGDNELMVCMAGTFQDGSVPGKIQVGPAWWFLDQKNGIAQHIDALSSLGLLSRFIGMTSDSRSFLSFPRHEYFRRILCGILGKEMEKGDIPGDIELIGSIIRDICYSNAKKYFGY